MMVSKPLLKKKVLESNIVSEAHKFAQRRGWWTIKVDSPTMNGIPDRLYFRRGVYIWIEWKKPGGVLSPIQKDAIAEMTARGMAVYVLNNLEDAKRVLQ